MQCEQKLSANKSTFSPGDSKRSVFLWVFQDKPQQEREAVVAFLQRLLGYGITGTTNHHVFTILYGEEGRNGKDTLLDTLKDVLGPLVGAVSNDLFVAQDKFRASGAPTPHLCDLQG